jgi:hypothetical protein
LIDTAPSVRKNAAQVFTVLGQALVEAAAGASADPSHLQDLFKLLLPNIKVLLSSGDGSAEAVGVSN